MKDLTAHYICIRAANAWGCLFPLTKTSRGTSCCSAVPVCCFALLTKASNTNVSRHPGCLAETRMTEEQKARYGRPGDETR